MISSLRLTATCAAVALATAIGVAAPVSAGDDNGGAYHLYRTPEQWQKLGIKPDLGTTGQMEYFGGSVFSKMNVVSVMWGSNVPSQTVQGMPGYFKALVNSTFVDQLSIYDTDMHGVHHKGTDQHIHRGTFYGQVVITPKNQGTNLTDFMIHQELKYQIGIGALPEQTPNTLYMIFFPNNITITLGGSGQSCSSFGAYHFAVSKKARGDNIFYGVMPDCGYTFDEHTIIAAHEFAEATTDNIPTPGTNPKYPQAWNTSDGYEIGDLCEGTEGQLTDGNKTWYVQEVYLNSLAGCGTANFTSP